MKNFIWLFVVAFSTSGLGQNLFSNPDFDTSMDGWTTYFGIPGEFSNEDGVATGTIVGGGESYEVQLWQIFEATGDTYHVSFTVRAAGSLRGTEKLVSVFCKLDAYPYTNYGENYCTVGLDWVECDVSCTPPAGTYTSFCIHGGTSDIDYQVDSASLYIDGTQPTGSPTDPTDPTDPSLPGNLFVNGQFTDNIESWETQFTATGAGFSWEDGQARASIDTVGASWDVQLRQVFEATGDTYETSFAMRTASAGIVKYVDVKCELDGAPWTNFASKPCAITDEYSVCSATCTPPAGAQTRFTVHGGSDASDFLVDYAYLRIPANEPTDPPIDPTPAPTDPPTDPTPAPTDPPTDPTPAQTPTPTEPPTDPPTPEVSDLGTYFLRTNQSPELADLNFHGFGSPTRISEHFLYNIIDDGGLTTVLLEQGYFGSTEFWENGMDWLLARGVIAKTQYDDVVASVTTGVLSEAIRPVVVLGFDADIASSNGYTYNWDLAVWQGRFINLPAQIAADFDMASRMEAGRFYSGVDSFKLHASAWNLAGSGTTVEPEEFAYFPIETIIQAARNYVGPNQPMPDVSFWRGWVYY